jgi:hypothetical protein
MELPMSAGPVRRRIVLAVASALALSMAAAGCTGGGANKASPTPRQPAPGVGGHPFRAFTSGSWWNAPLPKDAPSNPQAQGILRYMNTAPESGGGCLHLAGVQGSPWGQPVYWAKPGDPTYDVSVQRKGAPPEVHSMRIPKDAHSAQNNDGSMTVFDVDRGYVAAFTDAHYDQGTDTWSASGATVTYLNSNGLDVRTGQASDSRNIGTHRGNNGADMMVRVDEVQAGRIDHVLKVASGPEVSVRHDFPMVGSDGDSTDPDAPAQGLRFRIKPSVDLAGMGFDRQTLVIAQGLQRYGFYIGDSSGTTALKVEDTRLEGRGELWKMSPTALCGLPFTPRYWDVLPDGYRPPAPG